MPCPAGASCPGIGLYDECGPGSHSPGGGVSNRCMPCLPGTFASGNTTSECEDCPAGENKGRDQRKRVGWKWRVKEGAKTKH